MTVEFIQRFLRGFLCDQIALYTDNEIESAVTKNIQEFSFNYLPLDKKIRFL